MKIILILIQTLFLIAIAPAVSGLIRKIKNNLRMRKGPGIFQPYYNLRKLFAKDEVISENSSWIFRVTPFIVFGSVTAASLLVPVLTPAISFSLMGDFLAIIFLFALGRFFMTLAGLDAGGAFGDIYGFAELRFDEFIADKQFVFNALFRCYRFICDIACFDCRDFSYPGG